MDMTKFLGLYRVILSHFGSSVTAEVVLSLALVVYVGKDEDGPTTKLQTDFEQFPSHGSGDSVQFTYNCTKQLLNET